MQIFALPCASVGEHVRIEVCQKTYETPCNKYIMQEYDKRIHKIYPTRQKQPVGITGLREILPQCRIYT